MFEHLIELQNFFRGCCLASLNLKNAAWIRYLFLVKLESINDEDLAEDQLIELRAMESLRMSCNIKSIADFWISLSEVYPLLVKKAMAAITPFATTYLSQSEYLSLVAIKTKSRNRLNAKNYMRFVSKALKDKATILSDCRRQKTAFFPPNVKFKTN